MAPSWSKRSAVSYGSRRSNTNQRPLGSIRRAPRVSWRSRASTVKARAAAGAEHGCASPGLGELDGDVPADWICDGGVVADVRAHVVVEGRVCVEDVAGVQRQGDAPPGAVVRTLQARLQVDRELAVDAIAQGRAISVDVIHGSAKGQAIARPVGRRSAAELDRVVRDAGPVHDLRGRRHLFLEIEG